MTIVDFNKRVEANGGYSNIIAVQFNNNLMQYYIDEEFNKNDLIAGSDEDFIACKSYAPDRKSGYNNICIRIEKPMATIEGIWFCQDRNSIKKINKLDFINMR